MDVKNEPLNYDDDIIPDADLEEPVYDNEPENTQTVEIALNESENEKKRSHFVSLDLISLLKKVATVVFWVAISYFLGAAELPFGAIPFGVALLCAASGKLAYIYLGLSLSTLAVDEGALVYFCTYTAVLFIRVLTRILIDDPFADEKEQTSRTLEDIIPILFSEHVFLRMATSCVGAFIIGLYTLIVNGFLFYDLWGTLVSMAVAPVCVYLYCGLAGSGDILASRSSLVSYEVSDGRRFAAVCALSASLLLALRDVNILGMSLSLFGAMTLTLYFSRKRGIMHSLVIGSVCGLACSPMLAPIFAFAAISSGALWKVSTFFACLSACSVGLAWGLYAEGISALSSVLPAILSSALIFAVFEKLYLADKLLSVDEDTPVVQAKTAIAPTEEVSCEILSPDSLDAIILDDTEQRIRIMCEAFSSLSSLFYGLSEKMRTPSVTDLRQICDNAFDCSCHSCEMRSTCWEKEYSSSLASVGKICDSLERNGRIGSDDIPSRMLERCASMPDIINQINRNCMTHTQQLIIGDKTEIFALDYEAISDLLAQTVGSHKQNYQYMSDLSEVARTLVSDREFPIDGLLAYKNGRHICFSLQIKENISIEEQKNDILDAFEDLCSCRFSWTLLNDGRKVLLTSAKGYSIQYAKRSVKAEGEEGFCGDSVNAFESEKDIFYSFISDGMGSGRDAALTSGICSVFLSNLLKATGECEHSLSMLNGFLRNKGSGSMHECSATIDLLELDLVTGKADFYKGGAAPSYIYRDGSLFKLRSNTVPLGIIKELDTKKTSLELSGGDIIIMVSDGVTQSKDECPWLFDLLKANVGNESLVSIADMIVKRAKYEGACDDISVVVIKVDAQT